eukprot:2759966-Prymnesium_polylepis.1
MALALKRPFVVVWDTRAIALPLISRGMIRHARNWVDAYAPAWDSRVQAHALIVGNPLYRGLANLLFRVFAPPQPWIITGDEAAAVEFARTCCPKPRSWVKKSYADRDQRFALFGSVVAK